MDSNFTIPLNGLTPGVKEYSWSVAGEFFEEFGNEEILDASIDARASITKSGSYVGIDVYAEGWVMVQCDRCLEDLRVPVDTCAKLSVKFGAEPVSSESADSDDADKDAGKEPGREVIYLPEDDAAIDISQIVYDYVCLSLPMRRHHADGGCNPEAAKYLSSETSSKCGDEPDSSNNPFAALQGLFDN